MKCLAVALLAPAQLLLTLPLVSSIPACKKKRKKNVADGATLVPPPDVAKALVIRKVVIGGHGGMSMWYLSTESFCMSRGRQV